MRYVVKLTEHTWMSFNYKCCCNLHTFGSNFIATNKQCMDVTNSTTIYTQRTHNLLSLSVQRSYKITACSLMGWK